MRFEGILGLFVFIVILVAFLRFLWPLLVLLFIFMIVRTLFFPNRNKTTTYQRPSNEETYQKRPRQNRVDGDVIEADFEAREIDDEN